MTRKISFLSAIAVSLVFFNTILYAFEISGRIIDIETKAGINNVEIQSTGFFSGDTISTQSDNDGYFSFAGLKDNERYNIKPITGKLLGKIAPFAKTVNSSNSNDSIDFIFYKEYSLYGKIISDIKNSINDISVIFRSQAPFYDYKSAILNDNSYTVNLIYDQEYSISVVSNKALLSYKTHPEMIISGKNDDLKDIKVLPVFLAVGKVQFSDGSEYFEDLMISAVLKGGNKELISPISFDGSFLLSGLEYGKEYIVTIKGLNGIYSLQEIHTGIIKSTIADLNFFVTKKEN